MKLIIIFVTLLFLTFFTQARVIQVTAANVHLVVRSVGHLHLLLNHPQCPHSQSYASKYIKINQQQTIGIADCSKDKSICDYLNVTQYPTVLIVSQKQVQKVDEYEFLIRNGVATEDDEEMLLKNVLKMLKDEQKWVAVVLQEEQMPINDKVKNNQEKRVVYVHNPSRLHSVLKGMVGNQLGCWILVNTKDSNTLHRYYCGNGYKSEQLEKHLSHFKSKKIDRHVFTHTIDSNYIQSSLLEQMLSEVGKKQKSQCKLIYFYSKACEHCQEEDLELVKKLAKEKRDFFSHEIQIFNLDRQEYPKGLVLKRVPELIQFCRGKMRYFSDVFSFKNVNSFLNNPYQETSSTIDEDL